MIYGVSILIQKEIIDRLCFGSCGKILMAGIDGGESIGPLCPCKEDDCQYEEARTPVLGQVDGHDFCVRKLKGGRL